jgi:hypothetical protein
VTRIALVWVLAAGAVAAACGPSGRGLGEPPETVGNDASTGTDAAGTDAAQGEAAAGDGAPGEASTGEAGSGDAGPPDAATGDAGAGEGGSPPQCNPSLTWSTVARVPSIASAGFDRFGSVSANELTVAWTSSSSGAVFVADRPSTSAPFGTPAQLNPGTIALAIGRVALANSGHKLIAIRAGGASFVSFVRGGDAGTWNPDLSAEFINIDGMISEGGGVFAEPVLSADGYSLFYVLTLGTAADGGMNLPVLYESTWDARTKSWTFGASFPNKELAITTATQLRRPTGASSDRRTLFFFDETTGKERGAWRSSPAAPFDTFVDVSIAPEAAPSESCNTLYFRGMDGNGPGLFTATD